MLVLGFLSRETMMRWKGGMAGVGKGLKQIMGAMLVVLGVLMLFGLDKTIETQLVNASPALADQPSPRGSDAGAWSDIRIGALTFC